METADTIYEDTKWYRDLAIKMKANGMGKHLEFMMPYVRWQDPIVSDKEKMY